MMFKHALLISCLSFLLGDTPLACSPKPGWLPPTPTQAFGQSEVVLHAKVVASETDPSGNITEGRVAVLAVLKGSFTGNLVASGASSLCGIGRFVIGKDYVFFFRQRGSWWVDSLSQPPRVSTAEMLADISKLPRDVKGPPGQLVPTDKWDLPPYESPMKTMETLREYERRYQENRKYGR